MPKRKTVKAQKATLKKSGKNAHHKEQSPLSGVKEIAVLSQLTQEDLAELELEVEEQLWEARQRYAEGYMRLRAVKARRKADLALSEEKQSQSIDKTHKH